MVNTVLKFVACCRAAGYRISTSEVLDCISHLEMIDILDQEEFRAALRANFAKSRREQGEFDRLYNLFFQELREDLGIIESAPLADKLREIVGRLAEEADGDPARQAIVDFLSGEPLDYLKELLRIKNQEEQTVAGRKFNLGPLYNRLEIMVRLNDIKGDIFQILEQAAQNYDKDTRTSIARYFNGHLDSAYSLLLREQRPYNDGLKHVKTHEQHLTQLGERAFASLTMKEVEQMREVIERLVRKLKDIISRRYAISNRGVLDVKKTLRASDRYQGVPIEIKYRKKPPRKGKVVALCDISSSVWSAARFMLNILYSLQDCFTKVNSFVFVSDLAEVTDIFENEEINRAIERVLKDVDIDYHAQTDYGETLRQFRRNCMDYLNKKTTLIIIGDARSNYFNPEEGILAEMREKCRRLIWLNPENEYIWNTGDSEMLSYKPYCHELRECRNLNQLIDFIEDLVL